jgi:hypothetical protein
MGVRRKFAAGLLVSFLLVPGAVRGFVEGIAIEPPQPVEGDPITVRISGFLPTPCWVNGEPVVSVEPGLVLISIPQEALPLICIQVIVPYSLVAFVGPLPAGRYLLVVEDSHSSEAIEFEVAGARMAAEAKFVVCDPNGDGETDLSDAVFLLFHLFGGGPEPVCPRQADANGDTLLDMSDAVYVLEYLFLAGPAPVTESDCMQPSHCLAMSWLVDCLGHWSCECGECRPDCDFDRCGDGRCDVAGGETFESCYGDCEPIKCVPICDKIGSRSEGWYDPCTGKLLRWAFCAECAPECRPFREGIDAWYDSCTGELIAWRAGACE